MIVSQLLKSDNERQSHNFVIDILFQHHKRIDLQLHQEA